MRYRQSAVVGFGSVLLGAVVGCGESPPKPIQAPPVTVAARPKAVVGPKVGDDVYLRLTGDPITDMKDLRKMFVRAVRPDSWKDFKRFAAARDGIGLAIMKDRNEFYMLDPGTDVKILGIDDSGANVRVLDSGLAGQEFWVLLMSIQADRTTRPDRALD
jgi:hypothetical protein